MFVIWTDATSQLRFSNLKCMMGTLMYLRSLGDHNVTGLDEATGEVWTPEKYHELLVERRRNRKRENTHSQVSKSVA